LGGSSRRTMADYLDALRSVPEGKPGGHRALRFPVPAPLARLGAHLCDLLHFSPYSFGHLELMRRDNLPRVNLLTSLIGRAPTPVGVDLPARGSRLGVVGRIRFAARELLQ
jgi:hypothetical protein